MVFDSFDIHRNKTMLHNIRRMPLLEYILLTVINVFVSLRGLLRILRKRWRCQNCPTLCSKNEIWMWTVCWRPPSSSPPRAECWLIFKMDNKNKRGHTGDSRDKAGSNVGLKMMWTIRTIKPLKSAPVPGHCGKQCLSPLALLWGMWATYRNQGD